MIINKEKKPLITDYRFIKAICGRCNYNWDPVIKTRPVKCPNCQCRKWDNYQPQTKKSNA
ncbi:MAG: hypothetical protein ACXADY_22665 [Candidatus Hodarchaeales archaeon]